MAWENISLMLACASTACLSDDPSLNPPPEYQIPFHPGISDEKPSDTVRKFIVELANLLVHPWVPAQIIARDALGIELVPQMLHILFDLFDVCVCLIFPVDHWLNPNVIGEQTHPGDTRLS